MATQKRKSAKQEAKELEIIERGTRCLELRKSGASYRAIAAKLVEEGKADVTYQTVRRDVKAALKVLADDRNEEAEELRELQVQRLESQLLAFWTLSIGKVEKVIDAAGKEVPDPETGKPQVKFIQPNVSVGWLVLALVREISDTLNLKIQKHEVSGAGGGPVETVALSLQEWRKQAAARREQAAKTQELFDDGNS